jgi:hypothetical protein
MSHSKYHPVILHSGANNQEGQSVLALLQEYNKTKLIGIKDVRQLGAFIESFKNDIAFPDILAITPFEIKNAKHPNVIPLASVPTIKGQLANSPYAYYDDGWHGCSKLDELKEEVTKTATALFSPEGTTYVFTDVLGHHLSCNGKCGNKCWW